MNDKTNTYTKHIHVD